MTKITKTNFKTFIKKNDGKLFIKYLSRFNGMSDCVEGYDPATRQYHAVEKTTEHMTNSYGIKGAWLVGGGRDYFTAVEQDGFKGIEVYNCCGSFVVAVQA